MIIGGRRKMNRNTSLPSPGRGVSSRYMNRGRR